MEDRSDKSSLEEGSEIARSLRRMTGATRPARSWASNDLCLRAADELEALTQVLKRARQDINRMLNNREFLNAHVFEYLDAALSQANEVSGPTPSSHKDII